MLSVNPERVTDLPVEGSEPLFEELAVIARLLEQALARRRGEDPAAVVTPVPWRALVRPASAFGRISRALSLDEPSQALLVLAVAPSVNHRIACDFARLRHDPDAQHLSVGVAMELLGRDGAQGSQAIFQALRPGSPLVDLALVDVPAGGLTSMRDHVVPSPRLLSYLLGEETLPVDMSVVARFDSTRLLPTPVLEPAAARAFGEAMDLFTEAARAGDLSAAPVCLLSGPEGSGRGLCAHHLARALGLPLLRADVSRLAGDAMAGVKRLVREARLLGALLYLDGLESWSRASDHELGRLLETYVPALALGATDSLAGRGFAPASRPAVHVALTLPSPALRLELWQRHAPRHPPAANGVLETAAHTYRLTGGQIARIATVAAELARVRGGAAITRDVLDEAIRANVTHALSVVAREIHTTDRWEDLVVQDEARLVLRVMMANFRHRRKVYDQWGFGRRFGKGLGLTALFAGPPGTGKTMAAGILARELGLPLYQVELSQVVSKWVGETEKNLDRVFAEAEALSAVVLFDEADSLFSRRTDVSSANDRYANLEVNHLLQRVESFEGIVVLTTNNAGAIDPAFIRRFGYQLQFPVPDEAQRAQLWEKLIPVEADVAGPIRFDVLAKEFGFSGGHIKNAVIRAAFFAAELGRPIDEKLLQLTAMLELKQLGTAVRHMDVGALWRELKGGTE